ncbi:hypothetical protein Lalb_Chr15g0077631 [Lupinus albus]|uniref:Uncharacterized protein n=1 Tax=Lupinus albus TaxID=3870 RepID=A0A6A4PB50_LUPAL|nr:hypothetical protein Lalb_Chr15g0077631 [Lupinus albus]
MASKRGSIEEANDDMDRQVPSKRRHGHLEQEETRYMFISFMCLFLCTYALAPLSSVSSLLFLWLL